MPSVTVEIALNRAKWKKSIQTADPKYDVLQNSTT